MEVLYLLGASGPLPVFQLGRWWTVLSAGWLHGSLIHIFFNMMWVRQLAPAVAELYGAGRMILIWTAGSIFGFFVSSVSGVAFAGVPFLGNRAPLTLGASASIFALLGCAALSTAAGPARAPCAVRSGAGPSPGLLFGFVVPGIDNWAHMGDSPPARGSRACSTRSAQSASTTCWERSSASRRPSRRSRPPSSLASA